MRKSRFSIFNIIVFPSELLSLIFKTIPVLIIVFSSFCFSLGAGIYTVGSGKSYSTIQAALDQLFVDQGVATFSSAQTIMVYDGTYTETVTPNILMKPAAGARLIMTAAPGNFPVIDGQTVRTRAFMIGGDWGAETGQDYVTVNGFRTLNSGGNCREINFEFCNYGIVSNCVVGPNSKFGINFYGGSNNTIFNNIAYDCPGFGIVVGPAPNNKIYNNLCFNNYTGIYCDSPDGLISNNTCYNNSVNGIQITHISSTVSTNNRCRNNIVSSSAGTCLNIAVPEQVGFVSDYNCYYASGSAAVGIWDGVSRTTLAAFQAASGQDAHSVGTDPKFANEGGLTAADYTLLATTPCKKKGIDLSALFTTDYAGTTRTVPWDMGFIKYAGGASPPTVTGIYPDQGQNTRPTTISISGTDFFGDTLSSTVSAISLENSAATQIAFSNAVITDTSIDGAIVPAGIVPGTYNLLLTAGGGNLTASSRFIVYPKGVAAIKSYPNPFNPARGESILFTGMIEGSTIDIYTYAGERLRSLVDSAGTGIVPWDGKNDSGNLVASAVYLAVIKSGTTVTKQKVVVIR